MIRGNALVEETDVRFFGFANANSVVVFKYGTIWRLVIRFFELKFDDSFVDVLKYSHYYILEDYYFDLNLVAQLDQLLIC